MMKKILRNKQVNRSPVGNFFFGLVLTLCGVFMAAPMLYTAVNAFKPLEEFFIFPPKLYVMNPTLDNFSDLFKLTANLWVPFIRYCFNSIFVSVVATVGHVILASTAAYVLAKHKFPGKKLLDSMIVVSLLFTSKVLLIPQYIILAKLGWINTYMALIAPVFAMTLGLFLMKQFMVTIPDAMIESARIDGANEIRICWGIVVPNVKPALITLVIFAFQNIWNNPGGTLIFKESFKVLPTVLSQISAGGIIRAGVGAAAALVLLIPPVLIFVIFQGNVIETMSNSGIKG